MDWGRNTAQPYSLFRLTIGYTCYGFMPQDGHVSIPECTIYNRWYRLQEISYFRTPVTEALCSCLTLKEKHTEGVKEMLGNESDEGRGRGDNCVMSTCTVHRIPLRWPYRGLDGSMCGTYRRCFKTCVKLREEKHNLQCLVMEGRQYYIYGTAWDSVDRIYVVEQVTGVS
jgi:hypothetical protein